MRPAIFTLVATLLAVTAAEAAPRTPDACGLYAYRAEITRVIDGDTIVADIDLGFYTWRREEHLRLIGIDAPEVRGAAREHGLASKRALEQRLGGVRRVTICTVKDRRGSFGRYLAWVFLDPPPVGSPRESLNAWMARHGHAEPYGDEGTNLFEGDGSD